MCVCVYIYIYIYMPNISMDIIYIKYICIYNMIYVKQRRLKTLLVAHMIDRLKPEIDIGKKQTKQ